MEASVRAVLEEQQSAGRSAQRSLLASLQDEAASVDADLRREASALDSHQLAYAVACESEVTRAPA